MTDNTAYRARQREILEIMSKNIETAPPGDEIFVKGVVANATKELDNLFLEVVGNAVEPNMHPGLLQSNQEAQNRLKASIRKVIQGPGK